MDGLLDTIWVEDMRARNEKKARELLNRKAVLREDMVGACHRDRRFGAEHDGMEGKVVRTTVGIDKQ